MSSIGTGYDLSASTYSPDGRIFQVEYAQKAVENAGTAIALRLKDGILIAVEKLIHSKLLVPGTNKRIQTVDYHVGAVSVGLIADGRVIANRAIEESNNYRENYRTHIPTQHLADRLALFFQAYTLYSSVRPFGISTIIAGWDSPADAARVAEGKPQLYCIEPSGVVNGFRGAAIGKGKQLAKTEIEKLDLANLTTKDALVSAAKIIYTVHDDTKDKDFELELSWISPESGYKHELVPKELALEAETEAKRLIDEENEMEE